MDFNQSPYFDDFDAEKNFYKVLFRPGVAVQTRELNQLQSILQDQVTKFGNNIFKEGSMVIPGNIRYNDKYNYLKLSGKSLGSNDLTYLEGKEICVGQLGTGVKAYVVKAVAAENSDPDTLIVLYTSGDEAENAGGGKAFSPGQTLYVVNELSLTVTLQNGLDALGRSAIANMQAGVYYLNGYFVTVPTQTLVIEKYVTAITNISYKAGLLYTEEIITAEDDASLYDNATNTTNYTAPGAHRYKITAEFVRYGLDDTPQNFFELLRIEYGSIQKLINYSQYNIIEETLARRTYDESGNYTVDPFRMRVREHRLNNRESWSGQTRYIVGDYIADSGRYFICVHSGESAASQSTSFATADETSTIIDGTVKWRYTSAPRNNGGFLTPEQGGNSSNLVFAITDGKAYVRGHEVAREQTMNLVIAKSRSTSVTVSRTFPVNNGNYIILDRNNTWGLPNIETGPKVTMYDRSLGDSSYSLKFGFGNPVGTARIKYIDSDFSGGLKLGLFEVNMEPGRQLDRDVNMVAIIDSSAATTSKAYKLSGTFRYAGGSENSSMNIQVDSRITFGSIAAGGSGTLTSVGTIFTKQLTSGDTLTFTTTGNTLQTVTVAAVTNDTTITIKNGSGATIANSSGLTSALITVPAFTVFGATSSAALAYELREGDTVFLSSASTYISGTVTRIFTFTDVHGDSRTRMTISSTATTAVGTSGTAARMDLYVQYTGQAANFIGNILGQYNVGVNATKLTGQFTLKDADGTNTIDPTPHQAVRITATGSDARLLTEQLYPNDLLDVGGYRIYITRRSTNQAAYGICLDQTVQTADTAYTAFLIGNKVYDTGDAQLLYKVDDTPASITDDYYRVYKQNTQYLASATSVLQIALASGGGLTEIAWSNAPIDYLIAVTDTTGLSTQARIRDIVTTPSNITINLYDNISGTVRIGYTVDREGAAGTLGGLKTKTLTFDQLYESLSSSVARQTTITLPKADVLRINKILMAPSFVSTWTSATTLAAVDVTRNYELDDGQRDSYYDYSRLNLLRNAPLPQGSLRIYYDYFEQTAGDYFTFESYNVDEIPYEDIPEYKDLKLRDYLDFRPLIGTTSTLTNINVLRYGTEFKCNTNRYLARKDTVVIDQNGSIYDIKSVPAIAPVQPAVQDDANLLELFNVSLTPYTDSSDWPDISLEAKEHKRYTMSDIGRLEKRIENLEEVVSLSLLEVSTKSLQIRDNKDSTLERYKTGFFVDPFNDQTNAGEDIDNRFSINQDEQSMQAHISGYSLPLSEKINFTSYSPSGNAGGAELTPIDYARDLQNYQVTGGVISLPYTTSVILKQTVATTSISVAPFLGVSFVGKMKIYPDKDIYEDISTIKVNVVKDTRNAARLKEAQALGRKLYGSRYAITTVTSAKTVTTNVERSIIPFCRPNTLAVVVTGLLPNTKFYPTIDGIDIRQYTTGAVHFTMSLLDYLRFNGVRPNTGKDWARWRGLAYSFTDKKQVKKNKGVKVNGKWWVFTRITKNPKQYNTALPDKRNGDAFRKAFATGVSVYYREGSKWRGSGVALHQDDRTLYIANPRGRLAPEFIRAQASQTYSYSGRWYIGNVSGYFSELVTQNRTADQVTSDDSSGNLYSDSKGNLVFTVDFPQDDNLQFFHGMKKLVISDSPTDAPDEWQSRAEAFYEVEGTKVVITKTTTTTRSYKPVFVPPRDPVAQSFKLPDGYPNGVFLTGIDLYFQQVPETDEIPVWFEVRVCDPTGRPGPERVPGSTVYKVASQINVDSSTGVQATTFAFDEPIHIKPEINYAMICGTDQPRFKVWLATLSQPDVANPRLAYSTQATLGSLFKSQENTLWTEDQFSDLKFRIHRAVFDTSVTGVAYLVNQNLPAAALPSNPFTFMHGSAKVRVTQPNHGFRDGDYVRFYSATQAAAYTVSSGSTLAGIPLTEIFGSSIAEDQTSDTDPVLTVESCTLDEYVITTTTVANLGDGATTAETLRADGGSDIFANNQVLYHVSTPQIGTINFDATSLNMKGYMIEGHTYDNLPNSGTDYTQYVDMVDINKSNLENNRAKIILTDLNEERRFAGLSVTAGSATETWYDSYIGRFELTSTSDHVSPIIDTHHSTLNVIQHRIDNPTRQSRLQGALLPAYGTTSTFIVYKTILSSTTTIGFVAAESAITTTAGTFEGIVPGRYITIEGATNSGNNNTSTGVLVTNLSQDLTKVFVNAALKTESPGAAITIRQLQDYTDEATYIDATGESKYITRKVNLENPASQIKVLVDLNVPTDADFDIYYKFGSSAEDFNTRVWKLYANKPTVNKQDDRNSYTEYEVNMSDFDANGFPVDMSPFTAFQFKLVMRSTNGARIPKFRNFRVIAHA